MGEFTEQVVIITGASEGIGRALALQLAPSRPRLVLAARNATRLAELVVECEALGAEAVGVTTDVTQEDQCRALVDAAVDAYGGVDMLVANAGRTMWAAFEDIEQPGLLEDLMAVNYFGSVYCTRYALPWLKRAGGRIVAVASVAGLTGVPARTGYCASKHAMIGFFDSLRIELAGSGVSVTVIAPDFVVSEIHRRAVDGKGNPLEETPMNEDRIMTAEECAQRITEAAAQRRRLLITSARGRLGRWLKLISPTTVDRIAEKAIAERR
jgi:NAD(P)-dependent dehydrogenase (short-subunit alcohol dehydrogenase family)